MDWLLAKYEPNIGIFYPIMLVLIALINQNL
jgi:hypothetical protein